MEELQKINKYMVHRLYNEKIMIYLRTTILEVMEEIKRKKTATYQQIVTYIVGTRLSVYLHECAERE